MNRLPFRSGLLAGVVGALTFMALAVSPISARQARLDLSRPEDAVKAQRRVQCSLTDEKPVTFTWRGGVMSRVPGERDRHLFDVEGMNIRQCQTVTDPTRGEGWKMVSRELLIYLDPETKQVLRTWKNPWTGATNDVLHVANDPVNQPPTFARSSRGEPFVWSGRKVQNQIWQTFEVPLFYTNPMGGEYQEYVGGQYQAVEMFDFFMDEVDLLDTSKDMRSVTIAWGRISQWLPWMEMGDRPGVLVFTTVGKRLDDPKNLFPTLASEIRTNYPIYTSPPPVSDTRPNETSWTFFKKALDARKGAKR
jgi:hypothetical protein